MVRSGNEVVRVQEKNGKDGIRVPIGFRKGWRESWSSNKEKGEIIWTGHMAGIGSVCWKSC